VAVGAAALVVVLLQQRPVPAEQPGQAQAAAARYQFMSAGGDLLLLDTKEGRVFRREKTGGGPPIPGVPVMPVKATWVEEDTSAVRAAPEQKK
jgi:hypothetical protein